MPGKHDWIDDHDHSPPRENLRPVDCEPAASPATLAQVLTHLVETLRVMGESFRLIDLATRSDLAAMERRIIAVINGESAVAKATRVLHESTDDLADAVASNTPK